MNLPEPAGATLRRTAADEVYDHLHADIVSLRLLPGDRLSEVEIARQLEVSRQPVREAFIRLDNIGLLQVRPQKATEVRRISRQAIGNARFVRLAVEIEVLRAACSRSTTAFHAKFHTLIKQQRKAIDSGKTGHYHLLDYKFHRLVCQAADCEFAYATIASSKSQVDRLCMLSLADEREIEATWQDHCQLVDCIKDNRKREAISTMRRHLSRLDAIIDTVYREHAEYFEAD